MFEIFNDLDFYAVWPKVGVNFSKQLEESRDNTASLAPIVKGAYVDADPNNMKGGNLAGWEFGEEEFHNKFRIFWDKRVDEFQFQCNVGTEANPVWENAFYINCVEDNVVFEHDVVIAGDLSVEGDFYGGGGGGGGLSSITVTDTFGAMSYSTDKITFHRDDFYITPDSTGKPVISKTTGLAGSGTITSGSNLGAGEGVFAQASGPTLEFKSLVAGTNIGISSTSTEITIEATAPEAGGGFYGIAVGQVNDSPLYGNIRVIKFNDDNFYVSQNNDPDVAIVNFKERIDEPDVITFSHTDTDPLDISSDRLFVNRVDFYLSRSTTGKAILNLAGSSLLGAGNPNVISGVDFRHFNASREWQFNHNLNSVPLLWATFDDGYSAFIPEKVDVSNPNSAFFYFTSDVAGYAIVSSGRTASRVNFSTTNNAETQFTGDTLKFNRNHFYLESDTDGDPILNLNPDVDDRSITISYPGRAERISWWKTSRDITIQEIAAVLHTRDWGFYPGLEYTVRYDANPFATGTELITGGSTLQFYPGTFHLIQNALNNPNIGANNYVWLETGDVFEGGGTETELHVSVKFVNR